MLDIHNLLIYQGYLSVATTGEVGRNLDVWRVTTWYRDACGAPWYEECLWERCNDLGVHQNLRTTAFFGLL